MDMGILDLGWKQLAGLSVEDFEYKKLVMIARDGTILLIVISNNSLFSLSSHHQHNRLSAAFLRISDEQMTSHIQLASTDRVYIA